MNTFKPLADYFSVSAQISCEDVREAGALGFLAIINNRPDGESADQIAGTEIEAAAKAEGIAYLAIPITHSGFNEGQISALQEFLSENSGKILAYCRSGTRSTFLWSLAQAANGVNPEQLARAAADQGYDVSPVRPAMDTLFARAKT